MNALPRALARNAPACLAGGIVQLAAIGLAARRDVGSDRQNALLGLLLLLAVVVGALVPLGRAARGARAGLGQVVAAVVMALASILMVGAIATFFGGLVMLAIGAALAGALTEGVGFAAALLAPVLAWLIAVAASPVGAASYDPARPLQPEELVLSQRTALVTSTISVLAAAAVPGLLVGARSPMLLVPLATAIGAATGLLRARASAPERPLGPTPG